MFTRILAALDFSAPSDAALAHARALAAAFDARLHLLHVLPNVFLRAVVSDPRDLESAVVNQMLDRAHGGDSTELRPVAAVERSDDPGDEIVLYARTQAIDLIVMGTHGRRGMAHALMGSVAEQVVRSAPCPVLTVRTPPSGEGFTNILVPAGGASEEARTVARAIAARSGGSFYELDGLEEARSIAEYAADIGFDLIVMGTASRTGLSHVTGTLAERVIRRTGCPVITVPPTAAVARKIIHTAAKNVPAAVGR